MLYLLLSVVFYSLNNLLWKKVLLQGDSWLIMTSRALLTALLGIGIIFFYDPYLIYKINNDVIIRVTIASILGAFGLICMLTALQKGTLRQLGIFKVVSIAFTILYLFLFEKFYFLDFLLGTILIVIGFWIYVIQLQKTPSDESNIQTMILFALMSFFFASSGLLHWYNLKQSIPPLFSVVNQEIIVFFMGGFGLLVRHKSLQHGSFKMTMQFGFLLLLMAVLIFTAVWTGFLGLKATNPLLSSLMPLGTPILTILFGALFFKDKWNKKMGLALFLIFVGAFVLHLNFNQY